jgi:hypothetical protein
VPLRSSVRKHLVDKRAIRDRLKPADLSIEPVTTPPLRRSARLVHKDLAHDSDDANHKERKDG